MDKFTEDIVKKIEQRGARLRPRWHFLLQRALFWILAITSVFIGAVAFATALFVFIDNDIGSANLLETPLEDFLISVPFIWLFVLVLFSATAYAGIRRTKKGYLLGTAWTILSVVAVSICLGLLLNTFDLGSLVHHYLLDHTDFYDSLVPRHP